MKTIQNVLAVSVLVVLLAVVGCQTEGALARRVPKTTDFVPIPGIPPDQSSIRVESTGFSPNGDGNQDSIEFSLLFGYADSVSQWSVTIGNSGGTQKSFSGTGGDLPASLVWDGKTDSGQAAPQGEYVTTLRVDYAGIYDMVSVDSNPFVLDLIPSAVALIVDPAGFTPAGEGVTAPVIMTLEASSKLAALNSWSVEVRDPNGKLFRSFDGKWPAGPINWDGKGSAGDYVSPATIYSAEATVRDQYGLAGQAVIAIPVADIPLATQQDLIQPRLSGLSPNGDAIFESLDLLLAFGNKDAIKSWKVSVVDPGGTPQKTFSGDGTRLPDFVTWDGRDSSGKLAPEGQYYATLAVNYGDAFKPVLVKSKRFILDVTPPTGSVSADPSRLTPDGRGGVNPVTLKLVASSGVSRVAGWTITVLNPKGDEFAGFSGKWPEKSVTWNGRSFTGETVDPQAVYTLVARASDELGNTGEIRGKIAVGPLPVVRERIAVQPMAAGFSPNADKMADTIQFAMAYGQPDAVRSWKVEISHTTAGLQRTYRGDTGDLPATLVWDGRTERGTTAPEGEYTPTLSLDFGQVFQPARVTGKGFVLDTTPPTGTISLSPAVFSPDGDGTADTVTIKIQAESRIAKMDSWAIDIFDPAGHLFTSFEGRWPSNQVFWDGRNSTGEVVESAEDYPVVAMVYDEFGSAKRMTSTIRVGILVIKEGDDYRIRVPSIEFRAYTADYEHVPPELARRNEATLNSLADALKRFPEYKIKVVGHAVKVVHVNNPALSRFEQTLLVPLSRARAEAIREALVVRGIDEAKVEAIGGGDSDPVVPESDAADQWKNRRVDFFLEK